MEYLDFELPIKEINEQLSKCRVIGDENEIDVTDTCDQLEKKLKKLPRKKFMEIYLLGNAFSYRVTLRDPTL